MKEILLSFLLMVGIAVGASFALDAMNWTVANTNKSDRGNVRL